MRLYVAIVILLLAVITLTVGLAQKPLEPQLRIDAQSPGVWPKYAEVPTMPPAVLLTPCPLGPQNLPIVDPERKA